MGSETTRWRDGAGLLRVGDPSGGGARGAAVPLEIAASYQARTRGLLGRDGVEGAILLTPASGVHTFRMRFAIDVAYLDRELRVLAVRTMPPGRLGLPRVRARCVLESSAGAMAEWGLGPGVQVRVDPPCGGGEPARDEVSPRLVRARRRPGERPSRLRPAGRRG